MGIKILNLVKELISENDESNEIHITPEEYRELLRFFSYDGKLINNYKKYKGKKIVIDGDLNLDRTPLKDLGTITIKGRLDVSNTQIKTLDGVTATGYISTYSTPLQKRLDYLEFQKRLRAQEEIRQRGDWDTDGNLDDLGKCANALFKYLILTEFEEKEPGDSQRLEELYAEKERREQIEVETEDDENLRELDSINDDISEIENRIDVYDLLPDGRNYRLRGFRVATPDGLSKSIYYVGDEYDTEIGAIESTLDSFDGAGGVENAVSEWLIRDNIDEESLKDYFRDGEYDTVRDSLESFFDEDEFEYSDPKVAERIDEIEELLQDSNGLSQEEYDELNEELDDLKNSDKDVPEHLIDDKVEELLNDLVSDPIDLIKNYGLEVSNFVDEKDIAKQVVRNDSYGSVLNYYDGSEDSVEFDGDTYYIFEIVE